MASSAKANPSAPVPPPIWAVKVMCAPTGLIGVGDTASPASLPPASVSTVSPPFCTAVPLSCHVPEAGPGTDTGAPLLRPVNVTVCSPCPSLPVIRYLPDAGPYCCRRERHLLMDHLPGCQLLAFGDRRGRAELDPPAVPPS